MAGNDKKANIAAFLSKFDVQRDSLRAGTYYQKCPECSSSRKSGRNKRCLKLTVRLDCVLAYCNHCGYKDGVNLEDHHNRNRKPETPAQGARDSAEHMGVYEGLHRQAAGKRNRP